MEPHEHDVDEPEPEQDHMGPGCITCGHHERLVVDPDGFVTCEDFVGCVARELGWVVMKVSSS